MLDHGTSSAAIVPAMRCWGSATCGTVRRHRRGRRLRSTRMPAFSSSIDDPFKTTGTWARSIVELDPSIATQNDLRPVGAKVLSRGVTCSGLGRSTFAFRVVQPGAIIVHRYAGCIGLTFEEASPCVRRNACDCWCLHQGTVMNGPLCVGASR